MAVLERSRRTGSGTDKSNKHYKYTIDEASQVVLEFSDKTNYLDLSD